MLALAGCSGSDQGPPSSTADATIDAETSADVSDGTTDVPPEEVGESPEDSTSDTAPSVDTADARTEVAADSFDALDAIDTNDTADVETSDADGGADGADGTSVKLPWTRHFGSTGADEGLGVLTNGASEIIVHGFSQSSSLDLGKGAITLPAGTPGFLAKFDPAGSTLWTKVYSAEGGGEIDATTQAIDSTGNVFVGGGLYKTTGVNFGDGTLTAPCPSSGASGCAYVAKIDGAGKYIWGKYFIAGAAGVDGMACDGADVVMTGHFAGTIDFGLGPLSGVGSDYEIFMAKIDATGKPLWAKRFNGGTAGSDGMGVAVDATGSVLVTGFFTGSIDFGGGPLVSAGGTDIFLAKFDNTGAHVWSKRFGSASDQQGGAAVKADALGNVIIEGNLLGSADFGGGSLSSTGTTLTDLFVAKFGPDGSHVWSKVFGGPGGAQAGTLFIDSTGALLVAGSYGDMIDFGGGPMKRASGKGEMYMAKLSATGSYVWGHHFGGSLAKYAGGALALDPAGNAVLLAGFDGTANFDDGVFPGTSYSSVGNQDLFLGKFVP